MVEHRAQHFDELAIAVGVALQLRAHLGQGRRQVPVLEWGAIAQGTRLLHQDSNFPVDKGTCSYPVLWNVFKRLAAGYSADEKTALFSGAAKKAYRLEV